MSRSIRASCECCAICHSPWQTVKLSKSSGIFSPVLLLKGPCSENRSFEYLTVVSPIPPHPIVRAHYHQKLKSAAIRLSSETKTGAHQPHHTSQCSTPTFRKEQGPSAGPWARIGRVRGKLVKINLALNISAQMADFATILHKKRLFTSKHF